MKEEKVKGFRLDNAGVSAVSIIDEFKHCAKKDGWKEKEIREVVIETLTSDYENLIRVFMKYEDK
jgi:hypothetical protein